MLQFLRKIFSPDAYSGLKICLRIWTGSGERTDMITELGEPGRENPETRKAAPSGTALLELLSMHVFVYEAINWSTRLLMVLVFSIVLSFPSSSMISCFTLAFRPDSCFCGS